MRHWRRRLALLGLAACAALVALTLLAEPGSARVVENGSITCDGTIAGTDVADLSPDAVGDAVSVDSNASVTVTMHSSSRSGADAVNLDFVGNSDDLIVKALLFGQGGRSYNVDVGSYHDSTFQDTVPVKDYAKFGIGVYRVTAIMADDNGHDTCTMSALVRVTGDPLTTAAGAGAAALGTGGVVATGVAGVRAAGEGGDGGGDGGDGGGSGGGDDGLPVPVTDPYGARVRRRVVRAIDSDDSPPGCFYGCCLPLVLLLTLVWLALAGRTPDTVVLAAVGVAPRVRWRPRISLVSLLGGVVSALAAVVLLQQSGRVFPTATVVHNALIAGLAWGLLVPSLLRIVAVRRANRRRAASGPRAGSAPPAPVPTPAAAAYAPPAPPPPPPPPIPGATTSTVIETPPPPPPAPAPEPAADPGATMVGSPPPPRTPSLRLGATAGQAAPAAFRATHTVAAGGQPTWTSPGGRPGPGLDAWLEVQVVERRGDWARVVCANGWTGWVDARQLQPLQP